MEPPRKPEQRRPAIGRTLPAVEEDGRPHERRSSAELALNESERDFLLRVFKEQTDEIVGKLESVKAGSDAQYAALAARTLELERSQLEEARTRLAVQELSGEVRQLLNRDRLQEQDIGMLRDQIGRALKPSVELTASEAGGTMGKVTAARQSKIWGGLGFIASVVAVSVMQYCQAQVENYRNGTARPASSASK